MQPFKLHRGIVAPLDRANVDTDQIIPKQFLKSIKRTGFGESLFFDWRYDAKGEPDPEFVLNADRFVDASILLARNNFGCGSSREHAVWAVMQDGYKVVIAPSRGVGKEYIPGFADIFRNNAVKNGLLTVELTESQVDEIFAVVGCQGKAEATVDLVEQVVVLHTDKPKKYPFEIDPASKDTLLRGLDEISLTLDHNTAIAAFEKSHDTQMISS